MKPEFSRPVRIDTLGHAPRSLSLTADEAECRALADRFDLIAIEALDADVALVRTGDTVTATGRLRAKVTQSCVASGAPVEADVDSDFHILFTPPHAVGTAEEEVELSESDCDVIFYEGANIDVGEAVAESLSLSLDPWPRAPDAERILREAGVKSEHEAGPFAALAALRDKLNPGDASDA